jgi:hypothetical protein
MEARRVAPGLFALESASTVRAWAILPHGSDASVENDWVSPLYGARESSRSLIVESAFAGAALVTVFLAARGADVPDARWGTKDGIDVLGIDLPDATLTVAFSAGDPRHPGGSSRAAWVHRAARQPATERWGTLGAGAPLLAGAPRPVSIPFDGWIASASGLTAEGTLVRPGAA